MKCATCGERDHTSLHHDAVMEERRIARLVSEADLWRKRAVELAEAVNRGDEARVIDLQIRAILDAAKEEASQDAASPGHTLAT